MYLQHLQAKYCAGLKPVCPQMHSRTSPALSQSSCSLGCFPVTWLPAGFDQALAETANWEEGETGIFLSILSVSRYTIISSISHSQQDRPGFSNPWHSAYRDSGFLLLPYHLLLGFSSSPMSI